MLMKMSNHLLTVKQIVPYAKYSAILFVNLGAYSVKLVQ